MADAAPEPDAATFIEWIRTHNRGDTAVDMTQALRDVVRAVMDTGKAGAVTLKLAVKPMAKGSKRTLVIVDDVSVKAPTPDRQSAVWYADEHGGLHRNDPGQMALDVREPDADDGPVRDTPDDDTTPDNVRTIAEGRR